MTFIDLDLDAQITTKYYLTKIYAFSFGDDFLLAGDDFLLASADEKLTYDPSNSDEANRLEDPAQYSKQGLLLGHIDALLDLMLKSDGSKTRVMTYGEFEALLSQEGIAEAMSALFEIYFQFDPSAKPVLARMLLVQACLSYLILESYELESSQELNASIVRFIESEEFSRSFAWSDEHEVSSGDRALALKYIVERLSWIPDRRRRQTVLT
jgi:hypothetical protein